MSCPIKSKIQHHNMCLTSCPPPSHSFSWHISFASLKHNIHLRLHLHSHILMIPIFHTLIVIIEREIKITILTCLGFHVALTSSYLDISQAHFATFTSVFIGYHITKILYDHFFSILIGCWGTWQFINYYQLIIIPGNL